MSKEKQPPIAIIGVSALMPGSEDASGFWRDIVLGRDLITDVPRSHWLADDYFAAESSSRDTTYARRGGFLSPIAFDPLEFGIPPTNLSATDTAQLLALIAAKRLLDDATEGEGTRIDRSRTSVILGLTGALELVVPLASRLQRPIWAHAMREHGLPEAEIEALCDRILTSFTPWQEASFPGLLQNVVAGRIANRFDLHGANFITDAACASSLSAIDVAVGELVRGRSDVVIAGGVDTDNDIFAYMCFSKTPALSPTGDCRPFSDAADGTMLGEGLAMFALKRLADAERDGDRIYAVIRGVGAASDGRHKSIYAPRPEGQALAIRRAYEAAGFAPRTVQLVEAHGTGTKAGDAAEIEGLKAVFGDSSETPWCALGSIKSQVGHTKGAAGAAGLFKIVLALHEKLLPPTIKVARLNPALGLESSPFYVNVRARPWLASDAHPRRAAVSSFGFGGSNFHLVVEEYVPAGGGRPARRRRANPTELVTLSAASARELAERIRGVLDDTGPFVALAWESQQSFRATDLARLAAVAADATDLAAKLTAALTALEEEQASLSAPGVQLRAGPPIEGEIAFVFPGQGSQYPGMGCDLAVALDVARRVWEAAPAFDEVALHEIAFPPDPLNDAARRAQDTRLRRTEWAQPAIGAASLATLDGLRAARLEPACVAGHSFGELTALVAAGAIGRGDFLRLARRRGEVMRDAAAQAPGGMLAVRMPAGAVRAALEANGIDAVVANENGPAEVVVSGSLDAIGQAETALNGATTTRLPVSAAFHSPAVAPAAPALRAFLDGVEVKAPGIDVYSGADAQPYSAAPQEIRETLARQIARPVRFAETIEAMHARGVRVFVEVGPGSVLTDLIGRILDGRPHLAVATDRKSAHAVTALQHALAQLAVAGVPLAFEGLWAEAPRVAPDERRASAATVRVSGTNYGKPYPPAEPKAAPAIPVGFVASAPAPVAATYDTTAPIAAVPAAPAVTPVASAADAAWLTAFHDAQRQAAETHAAFQRALAESHTEFLRAAESSMQALVALATNGRAPVANPSLLGRPADAVRMAPPPVAAAAVVVPPPAPTPAMPTRAPQTAALDSPRALGDVLLSVVAEKTGYQPSLLTMDMDLEADLGIDSIKRVEILVAMQDRVPSLLDVTLNEIASLRTLGEVVAGLSRATDNPEPGARRPEPGAERPEPRAERPEPRADSVTRHVVRAIPEAPMGLALGSLTAAGSLVVTDAGDGLADALVDELHRRGLHATAVAEVPAGADGVIFLGGLRRVASEDEAIAINREAFRAARATAAGPPALFVTVQDTGGDFGLSGGDPLAAWRGGPAALVRTLRHEWPKASLKAIDCARAGRSAPEVARAIADELFDGGATLEVGLGADGARRVRHLAPSALQDERVLPREDAVIVATGGGRGVTAAALGELARARRCRFVLIGRTALAGEPDRCVLARTEAALRRALAADAQARGEPLAAAEIGRRAAAILAAREVRDTVAALEAAGSQVRYVTVDARDRDAIEAVLASVRAEWGPIAGLVHAAGVIADRRIEDKTDEQFDRVFDTKVIGLRHLLAATHQDPLELLCLFSSTASHVGNAGQSDYAMANEVLNLVAAAERTRRNGACVVRSIGWGPWQGGMVNETLAGRFEARGVGLLSLGSGARAFLSEMTARSATDPVVMVAAASRHAPDAGDGEHAPQTQP